jgi:hypothetical protein
MSLMPRAFLYDYDGVEENLLRVKFRPNPDYSPPTYEARVIHSLAGTILIDSEQKRLAKVSGQFINQVTFGFGLLGRIDSGTLEFERDHSHSSTSSDRAGQQLILSAMQPLAPGAFCM